MAGASDGSVGVWFRVEREDAGTTDGRTLVLAHALEPQGAAVLSIAPSQRSKTFATGDAAGGVWLRHATSEQVLLRLDGALPGPVAASALSPRDDGVLGIDAGAPRRPLAHLAPASRDEPRDDLREGLVRGLPGADLHLAVLVGHGPLRAEVLAGAADLRHAEGHVLLAALRRPDRAAGRGLHLGVRAPPRADRREADDGDDGLAPVGGARLHRRPRARADRRDLDRLGAAGALRGAAHALRVRLPLAAAAPAAGAAPRGPAEVRARCSWRSAWAPRSRCSSARRSSTCSSAISGSG